MGRKRKSWPLQFMALQVGVDLRDEPDPRLKKMVEDAEQARDRAADAVNIVMEWNRRCEAGVDPQFSPTIGAALRAGRPFLRLLCRGCRQYYDLDLRKVVRPDTFPVMSIQDVLVCQSGCRGHGPRPDLIGLFPQRDNPLHSEWVPPKRETG